MWNEERRKKKAPEDRAEIGVAVVACGSARKKKLLIHATCSDIVDEFGSREC